jgi:uncharacterized membrane protein YjgN (DUF898 family)
MEPINMDLAGEGTERGLGERPLTSASSYRLRFHGTGNSLFLLILKNVLLTLLTVGIYAAWAKTERRKFIWQNTEFHGQRFLYRGTGQELFIGYLKVAAGYAVFLLVPMIVRQFSTTAAIAMQGVFVLGLLWLIPFAVYWSHAYLLSRTSWRGVSFALAPGAKTFAKAFIVGYLLTLLTLGLYAPIWMNRMHAITLQRTSFGNLPFRYEGKDSEVWKMSIKGFLLSIVTLGVYYFWFLAALGRYRMEHTYLGNARGRSTLQGGESFRLGLIYIFGTTLTLGLAFPWIVCYSLRNVLDKMSFEGEIDFARVGKAEAQGDAMGDGLADAMDLGLSI